MWRELHTAGDAQAFMDAVHHFHDGCLKEMKYVSGAYVDGNMFMSPINDRRVLRMFIQLQQDDCPAIELEFSGLKYCRLVPVPEDYTCEIIQATLLIEDGTVYWADEAELSPTDLASYDGTVICASKLRWRPVEGALGSKEIYTSSV